MRGIILIPVLVVLAGVLCADDNAPIVAQNPIAVESALVALPLPASQLAAEVPPPLPRRLFGFVPNYRAEQDSPEYHPLTSWQKFKIAEKDSFDWPNYFVLAGYAMQTQVAVHGWHGPGVGKTFAGFYARSFGDQLIGNYVTEAVLPVLLHEDPRFFRSGQGTARLRSWRAIRQVLVTRTENGRERFNYSEVVGNSAVTAITGLYYPGSRSLGVGAERVALQLGNDAVTNLLTEFWPDIKHHFHRLH
jgi:hypothetical protein